MDCPVFLYNSQDKKDQLLLVINKRQFNLLFKYRYISMDSSERLGTNILIMRDHKTMISDLYLQ